MISVVIPAYKNTEMLVKNLRHNISHLNGTEIIIVNDFPAQSLSHLSKDFPVKVIDNKKNLGFAGAVNRGIEAASHEVVLLLNTDVLLNDDNWKKAVESLKHETHLFAVSFAQKEKNGSIVGKNRFYWERGFFMHEKVTEPYLGKNGWAEGGSCMIRKQYFTALGGFDELYAPFYWEDIDLSYRAWKNGLTVQFDPMIQVEHHHESTIGKYFDKKKVERIAFRNQFIFIWKNIDANLLMQHLIRLPIFLLVTLVNPSAPLGFLSALIRLPAIMRKRRNQKRLYRRTDKEILAQFAL